MATRAVWRPPWYCWCMLGLVGLAGMYALYPSRFEGHWLILSPLLVLVGTLTMRRLWEMPPAITMCGAIVLTVFSGGWSQIGLGGLPLNRLLIAIALAQVFLRAPGAAHLPPLRLRNVHLLMAATILYALGSAAAAGTLTHETSFFLLFDVLGLAPYFLFLVTPSVFATPRERDLLLITLVGLGGYLALTTFLESVGPHSLVFPSYIANSDAVRPGILKPGGPFQSPVENGFANFACMVAAAMAFLRWRGQPRGRLALVVGVACALACFLTLERGVWIAAPVAAVVTAFCTPSGRRLLLPGLVVAVIALGAVLTVFPALSQRTSERASAEQSVWDRKNMTAAGLRMVSARPLFGFGWERYESDSLDYFRQAPSYPMTGYTPVITIGLPEVLQPLHNTYLAYAVELGLIGMLLWLVSLLWAVGGAIFTRGSADLRPWKLGLLAVSVFFLVVSFVDPHQLPFPVVLLMIWAGVAWGRNPATGDDRVVPASNPAIPQMASVTP
jgi:O-antigen ligase